METLPLLYCLLDWASLQYFTNMESLTNKMRSLAIENLKSRREQIFERTRKLLEMKSTQEEPEEQSVCSENMGEQLESLEIQQKMMPEEQISRGRQNKKKKHKNTHNDYKTRRYWRRLLQVSDWMVTVPPNLSQFYVSVRGQGVKCLMIMKYSSLEICDKSGTLVAEIACPVKTYNGTILEIYFDQESKRIIISDLILWKQNPMTASEFDFRYAWTISNLNLKNLQEKTGYYFFFSQYYPCTIENLHKLYNQPGPYPKQGLKFVHKDSFYEHGHNPNVIVWKDSKTSSFFQQQQLQNKLKSKAVGYINKEGQVRSLQNASLFSLDRAQIGQAVKFVKFTYSDILLKELMEEGRVEVELKDLEIMETTRNNYGPVDCLGKLFYKSRLKYGSITFEQLIGVLSPQMMSE